MRGQWIGMLEGEVSGTVLLDLDERKDRYTGTALFAPTEKGLPSTAAMIDTQSKNETTSFQADICPINPQNCGILSREDLAAIYPEVEHDQSATIELRLSDGKLLTSYKTSISSASGLLSRHDPAQASSYVSNTLSSWTDFKSEVAGLDLDNFVWRGQLHPWSLQTSFHRTGRVDLRRYIGEDLPKLQAALLPHSKTFLELNSPLISGGFYSLAQHHGFPTPLLDWTYSPYVAAFFAFRGTAPETSGDAAVRIFAFNRTSWPASLNDVTHLMFSRPHVTILDLPALENNRSMPQQAVAMVTNLHNIEAFIRWQEKQNTGKYLLSFDIPWSEREAVMKDLRTMGITAASMFPGLDGTCEELRNRLFQAGV